MKKRWHWNERTRLVLTLELAVVLPAAVLIIVSVAHLKSIQRDRSVEGAIQRDFYQVLAISEKRMNEKAYEMVDQVRHGLPPPQQACEGSLEKLLEQHPYAAHLFLYNPNRGVVFRSREARMQEPDFHAESQDIEKMTPDWMRIDYEQLIKEFREMESKGKLPVYFTHNVVPRGDKHGYQSIALFLVPQTPEETPTVGGLAFDAEYLRAQFFPEMLSSLISQNYAEAQRDKSNYGRAAMMLHMKGEAAPLAMSADWDGGAPEMERNLEGAFPGLTLDIKLQGTTLASLGQRFVRTSFLILGGISLLLAVGILFTYRAVMKEMALAKLKSDFVSNVSHELRTPLSLIRLFAETLEMGRLNNPEKYHEYYSIIRKESERLTALINNVLDFSRIEAGKKEYDFRATDLGELARNTLESYRYQIEQQGFEFREEIADDLPALWVDREAISRSLLNLVNNALKYSQKEKYLGVRLYRANGSVKLEVIDHGIGIPPDDQEKIFEKFYRAGDPLVHNTKGSGLGLSLVDHIVRAHGGEVSVESAPGQGSKFTIVLPVTAAPDGGQAASIRIAT
ncbi:MAG TPA: HAMP domain-containing sensor histidine kinase [Terriglobia bacterium]|nr:HAMP domain-containing sensor histidine kinase [Terriglobia bacterium]